MLLVIRRFSTLNFFAAFMPRVIVQLNHGIRAAAPVLRSRSAPLWRDPAWVAPTTGAAPPLKVSAMLTTMFGQIVIVGAGQAADQAVHTLRRKGFTGKLAVVGDEPWLPYQRPPLSKKYLAGALDRDRLVLRPLHFYTEHSVETHLGRRVEEISRDARRLRLDDGSVLPYDALLLATGSRPRPLGVPGADLAGVHTLRTIGDVERIRADFGAGLAPGDHWRGIHWPGGRGDCSRVGTGRHRPGDGRSRHESCLRAKRSRLSTRPSTHATVSASLRIRKVQALVWRFQERAG